MKNILSVVVVAGLILGSVYYSNFIEPISDGPLATPVGKDHESPPEQSDISSVVAVSPETDESDGTLKLTEPSAALSDRNLVTPELSYLPTEKSLMSWSSATFDATSINAILSSVDYYEKIRQLQREQLSSPEATKVTDAYTDLINSFPELTEGAELELNEMSCGLKLCMGSINTFDNGDTWREFVTEYMGGQGEAAFGAMSSFPIQLDENTVENRFVFSIDPSANSFAVNLNYDTVIYSGDIEPPVEDDSDR